MHIVTFSALADFPSLLEAHLNAFPRPTSGAEGSEPTGDLEAFVRKILGFEATVFHASLTRTLESDHPFISVSDPNSDGTAGMSASEASALAQLTDQFKAARKRTLSIVEGLTEAQWRRTAQTDQGDITVIGLVHWLCAHDWDQLADLQRRMAACSAA